MADGHQPDLVQRFDRAHSYTLGFVFDLSSYVDEVEIMTDDSQVIDNSRAKILYSKSQH